jgi:hypothetical protein
MYCRDMYAKSSLDFEAMLKHQSSPSTAQVVRRAHFSAPLWHGVVLVVDVGDINSRIQLNNEKRARYPKAGTQHRD